jgi:putative CocE/NonD family hydrolase
MVSEAARDTLPAPSRSEPGKPPYPIEVHRDMRIPTSDSAVTLSADVFRPVGAGAVPALLTLLPYRKDAGAGIANDQRLRWFAGHGYATVLVDFRGTGSSDGHQRPPFDPDEAEDGVAAVEWAASQPWCDGKVGLWGHSYGAIMALRTASRRPPSLKAIIPVMGMIDPAADFVHPSGRRGCLGSLAQWAGDTLLNQLLPPLSNFESAVEQRRWHERLYDMDPWLLDLFQHGPHDPVWRARTVNVAEILVPTFCVAGWRDLFCDASIRAFELIQAPKKLLAGPWMHTMPEDSPFLPIDFPSLALRWWRHWLHGIDTGFLDEPPVTVYRQGAAGCWQHFDSWPPPHREQRLITTETTELRSSNNPVPARQVLAEGIPDPVVGTQSGLWGLPTTGFGLPLDEHDDDQRSLTFTSAELTQDLPLAGRPSVAVWTDPGTAPPCQLVVRLTDVDERNRSTLVTTGVSGGPRPGAPVLEAELAATCYTIPAGHRVRVVVSGADFPRLWPIAKPGALRVRGVEARLPQVTDDAGTFATMPACGIAATARPRHEPSWTVTRDLIHDGVTVTIGEESAADIPDAEHCLKMRRELSATVRRDAEADTVVRGVSNATIDLAGGINIEVRVELQMTENAVSVTGRIDIDKEPVFLGRWEDAI